MSRSYKKSPVYTDGKPGAVRVAKKIANKKVRHTPLNYDFGSTGSKYKRLYETYFIHDYVIYQPRQKHLDSFEIVKEQNSTYKDESFSDWTEKWEKWYKRK